MTDDINKVLVQGRITKKPELRETTSGRKVCDLRLASHRYVNQEQFTTYLRVMCFDDTALKVENCFHKGDKIAVAGKLVDDNFEQNGKKTSGRLRIEGTSFSLLEAARPQANILIEIPDI